jgi:hypothetical protein
VTTPGVLARQHLLHPAAAYSLGEHAGCGHGAAHICVIITWQLFAILFE